MTGLLSKAAKSTMSGTAICGTERDDAVLCRKT